MKQPRYRKVFMICCPFCDSFDSVFHLTEDDDPVFWDCGECDAELEAEPNEKLDHFLQRVYKLPIQ
ncbi:MAG TPA: hypothetical protein DDW30_07005 [Clostridiales bacterium]|nr:hypothetical protein [Clostridiales bacterium]